MVYGLNIITSHNGRLTLGSIENNIETLLNNKSFRNERAKQRAAKKLAKAFEMADGLDGTKEDGIISETELAAYDKEMKAKRIKRGIIITASVTVAAIAIALVTKNIQANKLKNLTDPEVFAKNQEIMLGKKANKAFAKINPDHFKNKGISYLVNPDTSANPAFKLRMGKTVGETLELNKEIGLELVTDIKGNIVYGIKNPGAGWENLQNWKPELADKTFAELFKIYPKELSGKMYFCPAGQGMIKAYGAEMRDGAVIIKRASTGVKDMAFQLNENARGIKRVRGLAEITHVYEDGSAINFNEMKEGWTMVKKGRFNPADPSHPLPVRQTVLDWIDEKVLKTLEGPVRTDITMTDGGGYPYNQFKDFWKQVTKGKVSFDPHDPASKEVFRQGAIWQSAETTIKYIKKTGNGSDKILILLDGIKKQCEEKARDLIVKATHL